MKRLSRRVASLAPSITFGLILFAVGLTALLAYRAFDASRAQQQMSERTLRDYAGFAAYQLRLAMTGRLLGQSRGAFELVTRDIAEHGPMPALGAERAATMMRAQAERCRCQEGVSLYFQVTFADSAIEASSGELATPENLRRIRDTVIARALAPPSTEPPLPGAVGPRPPGAPLWSHVLLSIFARLADQPYMFIHVLTVDTLGTPVVAYGFAVPTSFPVKRAVTAILASPQPILPGTLMRGLTADSILAVTVRTPAGEVIHASDPSVDTLYTGSDSLETRQGSLRLDVAIDPAAAGRLVIGGVPRSRLSEVLATTFVAVCLLGLLLYQFRRQEELARLRNDFVSGVSHELRTPLAQIRLLAELLHMGKVPSEERDRSLRIIDKEARRLSFLVDSILSFTHARRGQLSPVSTDIASEIDEIVAGFAPLAESNGVRLTTKLERGMVAGVDRGALRQVLLNLLDNAIRYGPPDQTVTITTIASDKTWTLEVADQGPGIPADERERIFDPYYRMERDAGGAVGGTGIGLAVVRRLVQDLGGSVHVASDDGSAGSQFVVTLPIDPSGTDSV